LEERDSFSKIVLTPWFSDLVSETAKHIDLLTLETRFLIVSFLLLVDELPFYQLSMLAKNERVVK